jgi:hypothetical protein
MRWLLRILGMVILVPGVIFFLQGINVLPGSFMTGQMQWAIIGAAGVIIGVALLILSARSGKAASGGRTMDL